MDDDKQNNSNRSQPNAFLFDKPEYTPLLNSKERQDMDKGRESLIPRNNQSNFNKSDNFTNPGFNQYQDRDINQQPRVQQEPEYYQYQRTAQEPNFFKPNTNFEPRR